MSASPAATATADPEEDPPGMRSGGQTVGMTTRLCVLPITYDLGTRTVRTVVAPAAKGPVFEFDLDAKDWSSELDGLFTMLLQHEDEFLKRRSDYQKGKRWEAREQQL